MHFSDIETAYKNDQYPDAECMLTYPGEVSDNRPFTPAGITLKPLTITRNGEYNPADFDADGFSWVDAEIEMPPAPVLDSIRITENGDYTPPVGVDGYNSITADIHPSETLEETLDERKTYNFIGEFNNAEITVDIPYTDIHIASGPVASFEGEDLPLKALKASITPLQSGSGDPSPENVRPITGWTEEVVTRTGKNLLPMNRGYNFPYNPNVGDTMDVTTATAGWTDDGNGDFSCTIANWKRNGLLAPIPKNQTISMSIYIKGGVPRLSTIFLDKDFKVVDKWGNFNPATSGGYYRSDFTPSAEVCYIGICIIGSDGNKITLSNPTIQLGNTTIDYQPYAGTTYTIPFTDSQGNPVEVYGGSVDVVNGVVTPCPYYASYNGEQLTGEWISDRDVYSPNTSPTIGAQVVNIGATGTPFSVQPTPIRSLQGTNNIYANTGDVYVEYQTEWTGESSIVYNAENLLVADEGGQYITNDLDLPLVAGKVYVGEINDVSSSELVPFLFTRDSNTSQIITLRLANEIAYLTLTNTTASLSNYAGSYRKVYLRLSEVVDGQLY